MNKNLRIGMQTGLSFGLAMGLFAYFRTGRLAPALINLASGAFFGAGMAWFSSRGERKLKAKGIDAPDMNPIQFRTVIYRGTLEEAIQATREAFQLVRKIKTLTQTSNPPSIKAKTGFTFESFGENISAEFSAGSSGTDIRLSSEPRLSTIEMDMGKGVENVETIVRALEERGASRRVA